MDTSRKHSFSTGESRSPIPSSFTRIDHQPIQSHVRFNTSRFFVDRYNSSALNVQFNKDDESLITHREEKHNKRTYSLSWIISWEDLGPFTEGNNWPLFTYLMGILIALLFLGELLLSIQNSGEAFELDPFNYMIGPSQEILIQSGARFSPCMKHVDSMPSNGHYVCLKTITANRTPQAIKSAETASSVPMNGIDTPTLILLDQLVNLNNPKVSNSTCSLSTICGMTPFYLSQKPDQLFRFVTPLFAHTGIFHVIINLCILIPIGRRLERSLNSLRYSVIIIGSGIFGHVVGANYSSATMPYLGCSSSLFGLFGLLLVDLLFHWRSIEPIRCLIKLFLYTSSCLILGFLPGVDSLSHVGGYLSGVLLGIIFVPAECAVSCPTQRRIGLYFIRSISLSIYGILLGALLFHFSNT